MCFPGCCSWPHQPIPDCPAPTGAEWPGAKPGWLLPPPGLSAAHLLPTWQGSAPAVAAGRAQAALSCCPLHKGTILGALSHPHRGTSSPASSSPAGRNLLGNENGNRNCPGSSAKCSGGRGLPQRAAVLGLEGAASISLQYPSGDARAGAPSRTWGHVPALCGSCRWLHVSLWRAQHGLCAAENSSGSFCPTGTSLQGSPRGRGATGCCPHLCRASREL